MAFSLDFSSIVRPLRHRGYAIYSASSVASMLAQWIQRITTGWVAWELTHSGGWLGALAFADLIPTACIGFLTGVLTDRWGRLRLLRVTQIFMTGQVFCLFLLTLTGLMNIWLLLTLVIVNGVLTAFNNPARSVMVSVLVPREDLSQAVAITAIIFNTARFVGPAIAGVVIAFAGVPASFFLNFLGMAGSTYLMFKVEATEARPSGRGSTILADLVEGLRYTAGHPGIFSVMMVMTALGLGARPIAELLPGIADHVFNAGVGALATLTSSMGVGSIIAGIWMGSRAAKGNLFVVTLWQCVVVSVALLCLVSSSSLTFGIPFIAVVSFAMTTTAVTSQTAIQLAVDPAVAGRVLGLHIQNFRAGPALGALIMGVASEFVGLRWPFVVGTLVILGTCLYFYLHRQPIIAALEAGPARLNRIE